jgi:hypothetical protein
MPFPSKEKNKSSCVFNLKYLEVKALAGSQGVVSESDPRRTPCTVNNPQILLIFLEVG